MTAHTVVSIYLQHIYVYIYNIIIILNNINKNISAYRVYVYNKIPTASSLLLQSENDIFHTDIETDSPEKVKTGGLH